ncbi:CsbD family protein [Actinomyces sp. B33]|uniref:CsbD family protein n=1 Tax=Actinomyces sp. B33 TaxID=2942131 RepID=UPI0023401FCE|nr:CsbD family protein [Actinomyces sp. B33]MDC4232790.1 CsbD family protein [Actinomyces sp. B33]
MAEDTGTLNQREGEAKEAAGRLTGDESLEAEGAVQRLADRAQEEVGRESYDASSAHPDEADETPA